MMHRVTNRKLGMKSAHRKAMLANMVSSLILHDRIQTTLTRAKELRRIADQVVTLSKKGSLAARRRLLQVARNPEAVERACATLATRFSGRNGGYTRIYRLGHRNGDAAPMALIEYLNDVAPADDLTPPAVKKTPVKKASPKKASPKKVAKKPTPAKKKAAAKRG